MVPRSEDSVQPSAATFPDRESTETTTRSPWAAAIASAISGSRTAAVPRTIRSAPAEIASSTFFESRRPPPSWTGTLTAANDPADVLEVHGLARAGAVEIDDVEPARSPVYPAPGRDDRIVVVGHLLVVVALDQPDGLAVADVNRRVEDQLQMRMKLARRPSPAELDFSGWNWTP